MGKSAYLGGSVYSAADVATYPWIRVEERLFGETYPVMRVDLERRPNTARWFREIEERPAVRKALIQIDAMNYNRGTGTVDDVDRLFGRGNYTASLVD